MVTQLLWNMIAHLESTADITDAEDWGNTQSAVRIIDRELLVELGTVLDVAKEISLVRFNDS